ncbi:hypothetical protein QYE76_062590 [Lolium multiflorum]|uniref:DUF4283 domain-containing protein n=1 Tax=Lolium multiflorum TaxID=4521 RepID=A0AAD8S423_LOLMU|nr:hypothetical protein QYE76_062590 [Lolium multiflorum]
MIAYGILNDLIDDHMDMSVSQSIKCVKLFEMDIVEVFGSDISRATIAQDTAQLLEENATSGFPGMLSSIYCMHLRWKNYLATWHGNFRGHEKDTTIILVVVAGCLSIFYEHCRVFQAARSVIQEAEELCRDLGHNTFQKVTTALRMIAYGILNDLIDDHMDMSVSQSIKCVKLFEMDIVEVFGSDISRATIAQDTAQLLEENATSGFPGMLSSIYCMHLRWKNDLATWHGNFRGHEKDTTIILVVVADGTYPKRSTFMKQLPVSPRFPVGRRRVTAAGMAMERVEGLLRNLKLSEAERRGVKLGVAGDPVPDVEAKALGKVFSEKPASVDGLKATLGKIWCPLKGLQIKALGENIFLFTFSQASGKRKALENGPWMHHNDLVVVEDFDPDKSRDDYQFELIPVWIHVLKLPLGRMNRETGEAVGDAAGDFLDVDVGEDGMAVGEYLRVKVKLNITNPLLRGMMV